MHAGILDFFLVLLVWYFYTKVGEKLMVTVLGKKKRPDANIQVFLVLLWPVILVWGVVIAVLKIFDTKENN